MLKINSNMMNASSYFFFFFFYRLPVHGKYALHSHMINGLFTAIPTIRSAARFFFLSPYGNDLFQNPFIDGAVPEHLSEIK